MGALQVCSLIKIMFFGLFWCFHTFFVCLIKLGEKWQKYAIQNIFDSDEQVNVVLWSNYHVLDWDVEVLNPVIAITFMT